MIVGKTGYLDKMENLLKDVVNLKKKKKKNKNRKMGFLNLVAIKENQLGVVTYLKK